MAKNVSSTVSGMGLATSFIASLDKARKALGVSDEDYHAAIKDDSPVIEQIAKLIAENVKKVVILLRLLRDTILIPASKKFAASDHFVIGGRLNIGYISDNFRNWFLGKVEEPRAESSLSSWELTKNALDEAIRAEIGKEKEEIFLSEIAHLLSLQSRGEAGALLINGYANIFYVRDVENTLRTVGVGWYADFRGWFVNAGGVSDPREWDAGSRFFSRNSS